MTERLEKSSYEASRQSGIQWTGIVTASKETDIRNGLALCSAMNRVEIKKIWQKGNREKRGTSHRMKTWNWKTFTRSATVVHPGKITKSLSTVCPPGKTWQLWRHVTLEMLWLLFKNKISAEWINLDLSDELVSFTSDLSAIHVHWLWNWSNNWNCYLYLARLFLFMKYFFLKLRRAFFGRSVP